MRRGDVIGKDQRRRHANLANGHSERRLFERTESCFLTVCRLNVLGPLFNQLTYCLCGKTQAACYLRTKLPAYWQERDTFFSAQAIPVYTRYNIHSFGKKKRKKRKVCKSITRNAIYTLAIFFPLYKRCTRAHIYFLGIM